MSGDQVGENPAGASRERGLGTVHSVLDEPPGGKGTAQRSPLAYFHGTGHGREGQTRRPDLGSGRVATLLPWAWLLAGSQQTVKDTRVRLVVRP